MTEGANPFGVRRAGPEDVLPLFDFVLPMLIEESLQPVSPSRVRAMVQRAAHQDGAIAGVIDGDDGIEASVGLFVGVADYTEHEHVGVRWQFVRRDQRGGEHGQRLVSFAKWSCEQLSGRRGYKVPLIHEILTKEGLIGKMRLLQRSLPQVGAVFAWGCVPAGQLNQLAIGNGHERGKNFDQYYARSALHA